MFAEFLGFKMMKNHMTVLRKTGKNVTFKCQASFIFFFSHFIWNSLESH